MESPSLKRLLSIAGCCVIAVVLLMAIDGFVAISRMNPVPAAEAAAVSAGFEVNLIRLRSVDASGGLFGSSAVVRYRLDDSGDAEDLEVRLRRPLLTPRWQVVAIEPR